MISLHWNDFTLVRRTSYCIGIFLNADDKIQLKLESKGELECRLLQKIS
jgi:hypothetical protein